MLFHKSCVLKTEWIGWGKEYITACSCLGVPGSAWASAGDRGSAEGAGEVSGSAGRCFNLGVQHEGQARAQPRGAATEGGTHRQQSDFEKVNSFLNNLLNKTFLRSFLQLIEEVQVKQPEVESVLKRADQLYKDSPHSQPDKVRNC